MPRLVRCPEGMAALFEQAEAFMTPKFEDREWRPEAGLFSVAGERYVMYRGASMAVSLRAELERVVGASADVVIYRFGKACGSADAKRYFEKYGVEDPPMRLALGPVGFALGGYATVDILPESAPSPDDDYVLAYNHPNSYEAEAYVDAGIARDKPVCHLNAGYSAGWCVEAFGMPLEAKEVACMAKGDDECRFVMAPPAKLRQRVAELCEQWGIDVPV